MKILSVAAFLVVFIGAASGAEAGSAAVPFPVASVHLEGNATDGDMEVVFEVTGGDDGLAELTVVAPDGRQVVAFRAPGCFHAGHQGVSSSNLLSPAMPSQSRPRIQRESMQFSGKTSSGGKLVGKATLTHRLPAATKFVKPLAAAEKVSVKDLAISWSPVEGVASYVLSIKQSESNVSITALLPGSSTSFAVPHGFLLAGKKYDVSIGTVTHGREHLVCRDHVRDRKVMRQGIERTELPWFPLIVLVGAGALMLAACVRTDLWTAEFPIARGELAPTGRNPYFILEPGYSLVLEGGGEQLTVTVLNETRMVDGVETRVVEERETKNGKLVEVSRNFFAISKRTNDVFYFGEEVDMYKDGQVVSHAGSWLSGVSGAKFGLMMPGTVSLNARYYQEVASGVAMDRATIVSVSDTVKTPAGEFTNCIKVQETTPLEPLITEYKYYAPGIGLVQDGPLQLVKHGRSDGRK